MALPLTRRFLPVALNQGFSFLFGLIGIALISHLILPENLGRYALFITLTQLGFLLTHSGLTNHASRYWQRESREGRRRAYARFLWRSNWRLASYLGGGLAAICLAMGLSQSAALWAWFFPLLWVSNAALASAQLALSVLNAGEQFWSMFGLGALANGLRAFFPALIAWLFSRTEWGLSFGFALHGLLLLAALEWGVRAQIAGAGEKSLSEVHWRKELKEFGRPFFWIGIGGWLLQNADRWLVAFFFGAAKAGLFHAASVMAVSVPTLISAGMIQSFFPDIFKEADAAVSREHWRRLASKCDRLTYILLGLSAVSLLLLQAAAPLAVQWGIISAKYDVSIRIVFPAGFAFVASAINQFHYMLLQGQHNSLGIVRVMLWMALVKVGGGCVAGLISWPAFLTWICVAPLLIAWAGRHLIHRIVFATRPLH